MITITHDELQALIAGYALGILDADEKKAVEAHLPTCTNCQIDLVELRSITDELPWSVEPATLPVGHMERFRDKAKTFSPEVISPQPQPLRSLNLAAQAPDESEFEQASRKRANRLRPGNRSSSGWRIAYAAALLLAVTAGILGYLLFDTNQKLNSQDNNVRTLAQLLASPNLKVTELQPTGIGQKSSARLLTDTKTNQALLVSDNLEALPADKAYQVWLIGSDGKPQSAAVFNRDAKDGPAVIALAPPGSASQYKTVAITVEPRGGSFPGPSTTPFTAGNLN